jgi:glycosyltransferase involved in cell wall biosynthesis
MSLKKQSICFISPYMGPLLASNVSYGTGGAERQFYLFGTELAKRGWRVVFIADCPVPSDALHENIRVLHVPFKHMGGGKGHLLLELPKLLIALMRAQTHYYAIKTAPHLAAVVCTYRFLFPCEIIMWGQTNSSFDRIVSYEPVWQRWIRLWGIKASTILIAQSNEQLERAKRDFIKRVSVVPNITLLPAVMSDHGIESDFVFWCGNDHQNKRPEVFIELARLLPSRKFVMAMNGDMSSERYQAIKEAAHHISNVKFLGSVPASDIDQWFAGAVIYVNTSIREGFPNTFLQSWQQGHPIVSINIDPNRNIEEEKLGYCLYHDDQHLRETPVTLAQKLSAVLRPLLDNRESLVGYAETCKGYVERVHSSSVVIKRFIEVMRCDEHGMV